MITGCWCFVSVIHSIIRYDSIWREWWNCQWMILLYLSMVALLGMSQWNNHSIDHYIWCLRSRYLLLILASNLPVLLYLHFCKILLLHSFLILISLGYWNILTYCHIIVQQLSKCSYNLIVQEHLFMIRKEITNQINQTVQNNPVLGLLL